MTANSDLTRPAGWRRLVAEGVVIVLSILLAFGIEASWAASRERARVRSQLATVDAEIAANRTRLTRAQESRRVRLQALQTIVGLISPSGGTIAADSLSALFVAGFSGAGSAELEMGALEQLLSDGDLQSTIRPETYQLLVTFRSRAGRYAGRQDFFRESRESVINYLVTVAPMAFISAGTGAHAPSEFPFPVERLLRDPQLEGLVGNLAAHTLTINQGGDRLIQLADSIHALLRQGANGTTISFVTSPLGHQTHVTQAAGG